VPTSPRSLTSLLREPRQARRKPAGGQRDGLGVAHGSLSLHAKHNLCRLPNGPLSADELLDHLVGAQQDRLRHRKSKRLGGL
jgi:hypothetical protein